eukprot:Nk52_evm25s2630 gene=Nk52_evmTU25s2630
MGDDLGAQELAHLQTFSESLKSVEELFVPTLKKSFATIRSEIKEKPRLNNEEGNLKSKELKAASGTLLASEFDLMNCYALGSLYWCYMTMKGKDPKEHPSLKKEINRIQACMGRMKEMKKPVEVKSGEEEGDKRRKGGQGDEADVDGSKNQQFGKKRKGGDHVRFTNGGSEYKSTGGRVVVNTTVISDSEEEELTRGGEKNRGNVGSVRDARELLSGKKRKRGEEEEEGGEEKGSKAAAKTKGKGAGAAVARRMVENSLGLSGSASSTTASGKDGEAGCGNNKKKGKKNQRRKKQKGSK